MGSETIDSLHHERLCTLARLSADSAQYLSRMCQASCCACARSLAGISGLMLAVSDLG